MKLKKRATILAATVISTSSIIGVSNNISYADTIGENNQINSSYDVYYNDDNYDKNFKKEFKSSNYKQVFSEEVIKLEDGITMNIKTIDYIPSERALNNGTAFGTSKTIKYSNSFDGSYYGEVTVNVRGQKVKAGVGKILNISYKNDKWGNIGGKSGAYKIYGKNATGNPAYGGVNVKINYVNWESQPVSKEQVISVKVYPESQIKIFPL